MMERIDRLIDEVRDMAMVNEHPAVLEIIKHRTPASVYPVRKVGNARIVKTPYSPGYYDYSTVDGYKLYHLAKTQTVTSLQRRDTTGNVSRWRTWMDDNPRHWRVMDAFAHELHGKVLLGGLGLGLVLHALQDNTLVTQIDVVEYDADVIKLMKHNMPTDGRINIIHADLWQYQMVAYDSAMIDIWVWTSLAQKAATLSEVVLCIERVLSKNRDCEVAIHGWPTLSHPRFNDALKLDINKGG